MQSYSCRAVSTESVALAVGWTFIVRPKSITAVRRLATTSIDKLSADELRIVK
jgi:hypothetical protein